MLFALFTLLTPAFAQENRNLYQDNPALTTGMLTLAGGRSVEDRYLRGEPAACFMVRPDRKPTTFFAVVLEHRAAFKQRFGERAAAVLRRISQVVNHEKPAHVTFTIEFEESVR